MSWERDRKNERVDLVLGVHFLPLVNPALKNADGSPAVFDLQIRLGTGVDGQSCPHCHQPLQATHTLNDTGMLVDKDGTEMTPAKLANEYVEKLNGFHARMEKHAQRHGVKLTRGEKK